MKQWTVYNKTSGDITRRMVTEENKVIAILDDDEAYIEGHYDDKSTIILNNEAQERPINEESARIETQIKLRFMRDDLLLKSDWTQVADAPVDKEAWQAYRQALRDLPSVYDTLIDINSVEWPVPPQEN